MLKNVIFLLIFLFFRPVYAEGSRELVASGGYRPFLEQTGSNIYSTVPGFLRKTTIKVFVNAGEVVNLGSSVYDASGDQDIIYTGPSGFSGSCDVLPTGFGYIDTIAKEQAGPVSGGYTPCQFTALTTGIYEIVFSKSGTVSGQQPVPTLTTDSFIANQKEAVAAWDVTVFKGGVEQKGRVYANYLTFIMGNKQGPGLNSKTYILSNTGHLYRIILDQLDPYQFVFFSNNKGFTDASSNPLYKSVFESEITGGTVKLSNPGAADTATDITNKMFFNSPSKDLPETATLPGGSPTWLLASTASTVPTITDFKFQGSEGTAGQAGTSPLTGKFSFTTDRVGSYALTIDTNNNGIYGDGNDRILSGNITTTGPQEISWDGLNSIGNPLPAQTLPYGASLSLIIDDIHFPFLDVESNPKGLIIQRLDRSNLSVLNSTVYYNNEGLTGGTPPNPLSATKGVDSTLGVQKFSGSFGDKKAVDTWTSLAVPIPLNGGILIKKADLSVLKTHSGTLTAGGTGGTYTITVKNDGPSDVAGVTVSDTLTNGGSWTCAVPNDSFSGCVTPSGTGNINTTVNLKNGATATFTVTLFTIPTGCNASTPVINTVTITRPNDVTNPQGTTSDARTESSIDSFVCPNNPPNPVPPVVTAISNKESDPSKLKLPALATDTPAIPVDHYTISTIPPASQGILYLGNPNAGGIAIKPGDSVSETEKDNLYFKPNPTFVGNATFTFTVTGTSAQPGTSSPATVTIPVIADPNMPPIAVPPTVPPVASNVMTRLPPLSGIDTDGTIASFKITTLPPTGCELYLGNPGTLITTLNQELTPEEASNIFFKAGTNCLGDPTFQFTVTDVSGAESTSPGTVTVPIIPNQSPTSNPDTSSTLANTPVTIPILGNDTDPENALDPNSLKIDLSPAHGTVIINADGTVTYTPNSNFTGVDIFTYQVCDKGVPVECSTATVTVTVNPPVNQPPVATNDTGSTPANTPVTIPVLQNDSDPENGLDPATLRITGQPVNGTVTVNPDGTVTYTPKTDFSGTDTFTYEVCDKGTPVECRTASVTVTVAAKPETPSTPETPGTPATVVTPAADDDSAQTTPGTPVTLDVLANDKDPTNTFDPKTMVILNQPTGGVVTVNPDGTVTYIPKADFQGIDTFTYRVCNKTGVCVTAKATVTVALTQNVSLTIHFAGSGQGSVISQPAGINCLSDATLCVATYNVDTKVTLTPNPSPGSAFEGWGGNDDCKDGVVTLAVSEQCVAYFRIVGEAELTLTVQKVGEGSVNSVVNSQPVGIDCGTDCQEHFPPSTLVTLTAKPAPNTIFKSWSGDCAGTQSTVTVTMDKTKTCIATFEPVPTAPEGQNTLVVTKIGLGDGTIASEPIGMDCGSSCAGYYQTGLQVKLTAKPDANSTFVGWGGDCSGSELSIIVPLDKSKSCTALFEPITSGNTATLIVQNIGQGGLTVNGKSCLIDCRLEVPAGTIVELKVDPESMSRFLGFSGDPDCLDGKVVVEKLTSCIATFKTVQAGTVSFVQSSYIVDEFGNVTTIAVSRSGGCEGMASVDYAIEGGSATYNVDYVVESKGTLTWADGDCSDKVISVNIKDDNLTEGNETVKFALSNPKGGITITPLDKTEVTIVDNDTRNPQTPCYNTSSCQMCCTGCQPAGSSTDLDIKSLITTIYVGQTLDVTLSNGKGTLLIKEIPDSRLVSLDDWKAFGVGAGQVTLSGVSPGTTKMVISDSNNLNQTVTLYINVIDAGLTNSFGIQAISIVLQVGQTFSMTVGGGKGALKLSKIPESELVQLSEWLPLGETGAGDFTLKGLQVGKTEMLIVDSAEQKLTVNIKVLDEYGTSGSANDNANLTSDERTRCQENAIGVDAKGFSVKTKACFLGKILTQQTEQPNHVMLNRSHTTHLTVSARIIVDPTDVGKAADILMLGVHQTLTSEADYMRVGKNQWTLWNRNIPSLQAADTVDRLPAALEIPIFKGDLSTIGGEYTVFVGYRLKNGTVIFNGLDPIHFYNGNSSSFDLQTDTAKAPHNDDLVSTTYFEPFVYNFDGKLGNNLIFANRDLLSVSGFVRVDNRHVGKRADILMVAVYKQGDKQIEYTHDSRGWHWWDNRLESLQPTQRYNELPEVLEIPIYLGSLAEVPGEFIVYIGYRLDNRLIVFNGFEPIRLIVQASQ